ncbi:radical SAM protein [Thermodesulfobacteriota bacterium]
MKSRKTVAFSRDSTNVFFHILTRCNLKCRHCYINPDQHGKNTLSLSTIKTWLSVFAKQNKASNVIFLGGEPTLHPDLWRAIKHAGDMGYSSVTVDTNGYLFNNILSKVAPDDVDFFSFSLDGATRKTNDMIRGEGSYDTCVSGIRQASSRGFNTSLIYTVSSANIYELEMMASLLKDLGLDRFFIQIIGIRGRSAKSGTGKLQVSREEWLGIIPEIALKIAELGITVTYPKVFLDPEESFECAGLVAENYFIFPNGRVYQCPLCEDYPIHSMIFNQDQLIGTEKINERDFFELNIPEGCVMNRMIQPENLRYNPNGSPEYKIACCMLKEEING